MDDARIKDTDQDQTLRIFWQFLSDNRCHLVQDDYEALRKVGIFVEHHKKEWRSEKYY